MVRIHGSSMAIHLTASCLPFLHLLLLYVRSQCSTYYPLFTLKLSNYYPLLTLLLTSTTPTNLPTATTLATFHSHYSTYYTTITLQHLLHYTHTTALTQLRSYYNTYCPSLTQFYVSSPLLFPFTTLHTATISYPFFTLQLTPRLNTTRHTVLPFSLTCFSLFKSEHQPTLHLLNNHSCIHYTYTLLQFTTLQTYSPTTVYSHYANPVATLCNHLTALH